MSNFIILVPFILIVIIFFLIYGMKNPNKVMKSKTNKVLIRIKRSTHFKILLAFIVLLIGLTIAVEIIVPRSQSATPIPKVDGPFYEFENSVYSLEDQIMNGEETDSALLFEKRTHLAEDTLTIERHNEQLDGPYVYIERKSENDGTIEEALYKPILIVDDYNFSEKLDVTVPIWAGNLVTFPESIKVDIEHTNFQETTMLNQLTTKRFQASISMGHGSMSRPLIVHLKVPKDLKIIDPWDEVFYIDE